MYKFVVLSCLIWIVCVILRIMYMGGLDPYYKDTPNSLFEDHQQYFSKIIESVTPYPQSSILTGMVLGNGKKIPHSISEAFRNTSTIHLLVVSGQNLSLLAGFLLIFTSVLGRKKTVVMIFCVIIYYSLITGFQVPVIRAGIMASVAYGGILVGRMRHTWWTLLVTAGLMLLYNPNWIFSISFQLSFLATFGVVVISPYFGLLMRRLPDMIRQDLAVSLAAQLVTFPIIAYNFGQVSLVGILSNCLILWTTPLIMISGLIMIAISMISPFLAQLIGLIPTTLISFIITIVSWCDAIPFASLTIDQTSQLLWIGYYLCFASLVITLKGMIQKYKQKEDYLETAYEF
jgi:competence protein ComEC